MELKQHVALRLEQKLVMTPQLQQAIKLLQLLKLVKQAFILVYHGMLLDSKKQVLNLQLHHYQAECLHLLVFRRLL